MARKHQLREQHAGMILNFTAKKQESMLAEALQTVLVRLQESFAVRFDHKPQWYLSEIVEQLREEYPDVPFAEPLSTSHMRPDGGILSILDDDDGDYPILITEVKNQGTNDARAAEGLPS